jgi:hypothetical protein
MSCKIYLLKDITRKILKLRKNNIMCIFIIFEDYNTFLG